MYISCPIKLALIWQEDCGIFSLIQGPLLLVVTASARYNDTWNNIIYKFDIPMIQLYCNIINLNQFFLNLSISWDIKFNFRYWNILQNSKKNKIYPLANCSKNYIYWTYRYDSPDNKTNKNSGALHKENCMFIQYKFNGNSYKSHGMSWALLRSNEK